MGGNGRKSSLRWFKNSIFYPHNHRPEPCILNESRARSVQEASSSLVSVDCIFTVSARSGGVGGYYRFRNHSKPKEISGNVPLSAGSVVASSFGSSISSVKEGRTVMRGGDGVKQGMRENFQLSSGRVSFLHLSSTRSISLPSLWAGEKPRS